MLVFFSNNLLCIILDRIIHTKFGYVFKDELIAIVVSEYFKIKISCFHSGIIIIIAET